MSGGRWRISMFREPQPWPFDHAFQVAGPGCDCAWVARTLRAALMIVDVAEFCVAHPELELRPNSAMAVHVSHALRQGVR